MVFFRRRGNAEIIKPTVWKKYTVAYSGTVEDVNVWAGLDAADSPDTRYYYDGFNFPLSGDPTLGTQNSVDVDYYSYTNANAFKGKIFRYNSYYFGTNDDATRGRYRSPESSYYYVRKKGIRVLATTARSLAIAGDYLEDVESEDPNAYPDNGPLGLYFYIKQ